MTQPTQQPHHIAPPGSPSQSRASESQLLLVDVWTAWTVINLVRKRAIARAFGVSPEDANAITVIGLALVAGSIHRTLGRVARQSVPTRTDSVLAAGTARALLGSIAGPAIDEMPGLGGLIALALVAHAARPTVTRSAHALREGWHRCALAFHERYGVTERR